MLSYATPATIKRNNEIADAHMAKYRAENPDSANKGQLSASQQAEFAAALARRKAG